MNAMSQQILDYARTLPEGEILSADSFLHLGKREAVARELSRLIDQEKIFQIDAGLFVLSYPTRFGIRGPSINMVVKGITRLTGERIAIGGGAAANLLGLSKHVPMLDVFWTSGPDRIMKVRALKFKLQHVPDWQLYAPNTKTGDAIRAFVHLGELVTDKVFYKFESLLDEEERCELLELRPNVPAWMSKKLSTLANSAPKL